MIKIVLFILSPMIILFEYELLRFELLVRVNSYYKKVMKYLNINYLLLMGKVMLIILLIWLGFFFEIILKMIYIVLKSATYFCIHFSLECQNEYLTNVLMVLSLGKLRLNVFSISRTRLLKIDASLLVFQSFCYLSMAVYCSFLSSSPFLYLFLHLWSYLGICL